MNRKRFVLGITTLFLLVMAGQAFAAGNDGISAAIAKQLAAAPGSIDANAAPGYLGIPGGPHVSTLLAFGWALWVGWIFSTVGAFGGVMAAVGHMSVYGLGAYAKSFPKIMNADGKLVNAPLNATVTDSVRLQPDAGGASSVISTFTYYREAPGVFGHCPGSRSIIGAFRFRHVTAGVNFSSYQAISAFSCLCLAST